MITKKKTETAVFAGAYLHVFLLGFFAYCFFEIALRGRTHWTMGILGGLSLAVLYSIERRLTDSLPVKALIGTCFVTAAEFTVGVFDNLIMGWAVWDYSERPLNILGQVCPLFSGIWFLLCLLGILLCRKLAWMKEGES